MNACNATLVLEKGSIVEHDKYEQLVSEKSGIQTDLVAKCRVQDHSQSKTIEGVERQSRTSRPWSFWSLCSR